MEGVICGLPIIFGLIFVGLIGLFIWFHGKFSIPFMKNANEMMKNSVKRENNKEQLLSDIKGELSTRNNSVPKGNNPMEEIEKLFQMKEKGIISEEDYKTMKEKIIKNN